MFRLAALDLLVSGACLDCSGIGTTLFRLERPCFYSSGLLLCDFLNRDGTGIWRVGVDFDKMLGSLWVPPIFLSYQLFLLFIASLIFQVYVTVAYGNDAVEYEFITANDALVSTFDFEELLAIDFLKLRFAFFEIISKPSLVAYTYLLSTFVCENARSLSIDSVIFAMRVFCPTRNCSASSIKF